MAQAVEIRPRRCQVMLIATDELETQGARVSTTMAFI